MIFVPKIFHIRHKRYQTKSLILQAQVFSLLILTNWKSRIVGTFYSSLRDTLPPKWPGFCFTLLICNPGLVACCTWPNKNITVMSSHQVHGSFIHNNCALPQLIYLSIYLMVYSLHHNVLPTLQPIPSMTNGPLCPITQDSSCHGQHTMPRNPWSFPMTSSA